MRLVVQKFGGSSVANATRMKAAARRAIRAKQAGNQVIVVVSARGDTTDDLIDLAREITEQPPAREMDMLLATGEQQSIALMAMAIQDLGDKAVSFTGAQVGIVTDRTHTKARIKSITTARMRRALNEGHIVIVAGFQGIDEDYNITTLGRGGSDTTAVALAAVMKHDSDPAGTRPPFRPPGEGEEEKSLFVPQGSSPLPLPPADRLAEVGCEIYTDVDGVYTTDPRQVPEARKIDIISYDEMLELASAGAGVMHSRSIEFAKKFDVPLQVRNSLSDAEGTWIVPETPWMTQTPVCGAALVRDEARVAIINVPDRPGISHRIFNAIAERNIVVDMIAQNVGSGGRAAIGFTVPGGELKSTQDVLGPLAEELGAQVEADAEVSKLSIVGAGMRTHTGVAERMFAALAQENINVKMITTADIKITVLIDRTDAVRALRAVHQAFNLKEARAGAGLPPPAGFTLHAPGPTAHDLAGLQRRLEAMEEILVTDVELATDHGRVTIFGLPDQAGNGSKVFQAVAEAGVVVDMIVQNMTAGNPELSFSVPLRDLARTAEVTRKIARSLSPSAEVSADDRIANLIVHGVGMRTHTGVARRIFGALAARNINIGMINTSEVRFSVVVDRDRGEEALACLREAFGLG